MKFRFLLFLLLIFSCTNRNFEQTNKTEIKNVIKTVIENISLDTRYLVISRMSRNSLSINGHDYRDSLLPPNVYSIDFNELLNYLSSGKTIKQYDSLFVLHQIDSVKSVSFDSSVFSHNKLSYFRPENYYYEFFIPLFSNDYKKAFIQYHIGTENYDLVRKKIWLEKNNNKWVIIKKI
jgi:hypothetical protein